MHKIKTCIAKNNTLPSLDNQNLATHYLQHVAHQNCDAQVFRLKRQLQMNNMNSMNNQSMIWFTKSEFFPTTEDVIWFKRKRDLRQQVSTRKDIR